MNIHQTSTNVQTKNAKNHDQSLTLYQTQRVLQEKDQSWHFDEIGGTDCRQIDTIMA